MAIVDDNARTSVDMLGYPVVNLACILVRDKHKGGVVKLLDYIVYTLYCLTTRYACRVDKLYICEVALLRRVAIEPLRIFDAWRALAKGNGLRLCSRNGEQSA